MTTGLYCGMFADFSEYVIADALLMEMLRLEELYAATNEVGFIIRRKTDVWCERKRRSRRIKLA